MRGDPVVGPHPAIKMFALCAGMKWTHLPVAGGLYDQDPDLLDKFEFMFRKIAEQERRQQEEREREQKKNEHKQRRNSARMPRGGRR